MKKVAVIGAGVMGLASARELANAGCEVTVFEKGQLFHKNGSSHGTSRIIRRAYADPYYCALMCEAYELWRELEVESGTELFVKTGLLIVGNDDAQFLRDTRKSLTENRIPFDSFSCIETVRRFPGFHLDFDESSLFEFDAGYLKSDKILKALARLCAVKGVTIHENTDVKLNDLADRYDEIVICAGSFVKQFVDLDCRVTLQHAAYFLRHDTTDFPSWIDANSMFYGIPDYGKGVKVAQHVTGQEVTPNSPHEIDKGEIKRIWEYAKMRFGNHVEVGDVLNCLYTVTPSEDFRIGKLDSRVPAYYLSPCSGHGFKFATFFGKLAAELVNGSKTLEDFPKFLSGTSNRQTTVE